MMARRERAPNCSCVICGTPLYRTPKALEALRRGPTCSQKCNRKNWGPPSKLPGVGAKISATQLGNAKHGPDNRAWKGGVTYSGGYRLLRKPDHPRAHGGYVREHILVAESMLGRELAPGEVVHHRNGDTLDNRPQNLEVFSSSGKHISARHPRSRPVRMAECHPDRKHRANGLCKQCFGAQLSSRRRQRDRARKNLPPIRPAPCHPDREHYAKGMCYACYQKVNWGRWYDRHKRSPA